MTNSPCSQFWHYRLVMYFSVFQNTQFHINRGHMYFVFAFEPYYENRHFLTSTRYWFQTLLILTYCIVWKQSCVVIQNKPPILPAFHNICPLAQWTLHRSHCSRNNYDQLPQTSKYLTGWVRQLHITSRRNTRHRTEHRLPSMGQRWKLRTTVTRTEHPCSNT
jgi:hypothetical protein